MSKRLAAILLLAISSIAIVYNLLILIGVIPYRYAWGGRLESHAQMVLLESLTLGVNALIVVIISVKAGFMRQLLPGAVVTATLWLFAGVFLLNTIGNLFALTAFEAIIFTPLTLLASYLFYRLAVDKS